MFQPVSYCTASPYPGHLLLLLSHGLILTLIELDVSYTPGPSKWPFQQGLRVLGDIHGRELLEIIGLHIVLSNIIINFVWFRRGADQSTLM